ncbi:hypothetical protein [Pedobacter gandavensis]|uniref:Uncharacterized protein n=1 Tax=Pedobacter gandavensis TaxID=2679963 RepID=A0ABR6EVS3_9SPHI|nr:hypothetical protein [Pedobacter gandavensis]MBB2149291.1 hypothetical protein [Pedobacter gandavensis]
MVRPFRNQPSIDDEYQWRVFFYNLLSPFTVLMTEASESYPSNLAFEGAANIFYKLFG